MSLERTRIVLLDKNGPRRGLLTRALANASPDPSQILEVPSLHTLKDLDPAQTLLLVWGADSLSQIATELAALCSSQPGYPLLVISENPADPLLVRTWTRQGVTVLSGPMANWHGLARILRQFQSAPPSPQQAATRPEPGNAKPSLAGLPRKENPPPPATLALELLEELPVSLAVLSTKGDVLFANPAAQTLLAQTTLHREPEGLAFDPQAAREKALPLQLPRPGLKPLEVEVQASSIRWQGTPAWLTIWQDRGPRLREEERRLEQAAERCRQEKLEALGNLAGGMGHEMNNILMVVNGYADLLARGALPEKAAEAVGHIKSAGDRGATLVRRLMAFGRREALAVERLDLNQLCQDAERRMRNLLPEGIALVLQLEAGPCWVRADGSHLEQALGQLIQNACEAMPGGGVIRVRVFPTHLEQPLSRGSRSLEPGAYVVLEVCDTGQGMDAQTQQRIFDPFFTTKRTGRGLGLGLAIVHAIVEQNGGAQEVVSAPGRGTVIRIFLPYQSQARSPRRSGFQETVKDRRKRILLAEDEASIRHLLRETLEEAGFEVLEACNGREALERIERLQGPLDVVVSDILMPELDGIELAKQVTRLRPETNIILMTGFTSAELPSRDGLDREIFILKKPLTPQELLEKVQEALTEEA